MATPTAAPTTPLTSDAVDLATITNRMSTFLYDQNTDDVPTTQAAVLAERKLQDDMYNLQLQRAADNERYQHSSAFQRNTDLLAQLNESWDANAYIRRALKAEMGRVGRLDQLSRRDVQRVRETSLYTQYAARRYAFCGNLMAFTLVVTLLVMIPASFWRVDGMSGTALVVIDGLVLVLYALVVSVMFKGVAERRLYEWDRIYWRANPTILKEMQSAQS
jgi:hypothetical protein